MATDIISLSEINSRISNDASSNLGLILSDFILGRVPFALFKQVFRRQSNFRVINCKVLEMTEAHLKISGTFVRIFEWQDVAVEIYLFDYSGSAITKERHCLIRIEQNT